MHHPIRRGGPRTDAGKAASSQNAAKHGLTARTPHTLANENPEVWALVFAEHVKVYAPANPVEHALVEEIAFAGWKLRRLMSIETGMFDVAMEEQAPELAKDYRNLTESVRTAFAFHYLADDRRSLALLSRYQGQIERSRDRAIRNLRELQDRRKQEAKEAKEAAAIAEKEAAQNVKEPSEPSKPQQNQQIADFAKRTGGQPEFIQVTRPAAPADAQNRPQDPRTGPDTDLKGGPTHEKAA